MTVVHRETHEWTSPRLGQSMHVNVYGDRGQPVLIFPSQEGRYCEYEDFGMVEACRPFIEAGSLHLVCVDSVDGQSWVHPSLPASLKARRHLDYESYILQEVVPWIRARVGPDATLLASGCSMGAYHAANFYFRHPDVFDSVIALSGIYDLSLFIGDAMDAEIYLQTPLAYLPSLRDPWYLERYRRGRIVLCVGQGDWEEPMLPQTRRMADILKDLDVPAWIDVWGHDVAHDWPWWRLQMPYFLEQLGYARTS